MSKLDAQRAMREAKWARTQERAAAASSGSGTAAARRARPPVAPPLEQPSKAMEAAASEAVAPGEALCGHASMNGRTCTRPAGHAQKSHRYS